MTRIIIIRQRGMDAEKPARVTAWRKNRVFKRYIDRNRIIDNSADKNTEKIRMALAQGRRGGEDLHGPCARTSTSAR